MLGRGADSFGDFSSAQDSIWKVCANSLEMPLTKADFMLG